MSDADDKAAEWAIEVIRGDTPGLAEIAEAIDRINLEMARAFGIPLRVLRPDLYPVLPTTKALPPGE